jgi:hypothetical protein
VIDHLFTNSNLLHKALQMQLMRHPRLFTADELEQYQSESLSTGLEQCLPTTPSVAGFGFACCAASLPLLISRDLEIVASVVELVREALPMIFEPMKDPKLRQTETTRLQHLLNRIDQVTDMRLVRKCTML